MIFKRKRYISASVVNEAPASFLLSAAGVSNGSYTANSLSSDFDNSAGTSSLINGVRAIQATDNTNGFAVIGKKKSRDQEINFKVKGETGLALIRLTDDGKAWYMYFNIPTQRVEIGLAHNIFTSGVLYYELLTKGVVGNFTTFNTQVPGFSTTDENDIITFGASGWEIYVKYNGVEVIRYKTKYHCKPGKTAIKTVTGTGVVSCNAEHFTRTFTYSNTDTNTINARDFYFKSVSTTGSMTAGSNQITLASVAGLEPTDTIIVETGGEPVFNGRAAGDPGTLGVGNSHPLQRYTTLTAMQSDLSKPNGLWAWVESTGDNRKFNSSNNTWELPTNPYDLKCMPKSLRGKIISIVGNVVTLDKSCAADTTNANVHYDNNYVFSSLSCPAFEESFLGKYAETTPYNMSLVAENNKTYYFPSGSYAVGEQMYYQIKDAVAIGAGKDNTIFFTPKGAGGLNLQLSAADRTRIKDMQFVGNAGVTGYGSLYETWYGPAKSGMITQYEGFSSKIPRGIGYGGTHDAIAEDIKVKNIWWSCFGAGSYSGNILRKNIHLQIDFPFLAYVQWHFQDSDSEYNTFYRCTFSSPYITKVYESFRCKNTQFIECGGQNAMWSDNSGVDTVNQDCYTTLTANSKAPAINILEPIYNINTNIAISDDPDLNLINSNINVINFAMIVQGYTDTDNNIISGINVNAYNDNVFITGGSYTAPNQFSDSTKPPIGINSSGPNTVIDGFTASGNLLPGNYGNITQSKGTLKRTTAPLMKVGATVVLGTGAEANTGTIVVN